MPGTINIYKSTFLSLPAEVRLSIYDLALPGEIRLRRYWIFTSHPSFAEQLLTYNVLATEASPLLLLNKQVYQEARPLVLRRTTLESKFARIGDQPEDGLLCFGKRYHSNPTYFHNIKLDWSPSALLGLDIGHFRDLKTLRITAPDYHQAGNHKDNVYTICLRKVQGGQPYDLQSCLQDLGHQYYQAYDDGAFVTGKLQGLSKRCQVSIVFAKSRMCVKSCASFVVIDLVSKLHHFRDDKLTT